MPKKVYYCLRKMIELEFQFSHFDEVIFNILNHVKPKL